MMTLEQFDEFVDLVLSNLNNGCQEEYYGTDRDITEGMLDHARCVIYSKELEDAKEYTEYLRLKAKFEDIKPCES